MMALIGFFRCQKDDKLLQTDQVFDDMEMWILNDEDQDRVRVSNRWEK